MTPRIHTFVSADLLVATLSEQLATVANHCIEQAGHFRIVLAGGTTPRELYQRLRNIDTDWQRWHIYFGDERCLPVGDVERNDAMAASAWLDHVEIPRAQIYSVPAKGDVYAQAAAYAAVLDEVDSFDLVLLGLGEDGHTASLFPEDMQFAQTTEQAVAVTNAPKLPLQRVSMSADRLSRAAAVWFIVTGNGKRAALNAWLDGAPLPPHFIVPKAGLDIYTDIAL